MKRLAQAAVGFSVVGLAAGLLQWADSVGPLMASLSPELFDFVLLAHIACTGLALVFVTLVVARTTAGKSGAENAPPSEDKD